MLWLKSCPRCDTGDLYGGSDMYGKFILCLQCGYYLNEAEEIVLKYPRGVAVEAAPKKRAGRKATAAVAA